MVFDFTMGDFNGEDYFEICKQRQSYNIHEPKGNKIMITFILKDKKQCDCIYFYKTNEDVYNMIKQGKQIDLKSTYVKDFVLTDILEKELNTFNAYYSFWDGSVSFEAATFSNGNINFDFATFGCGSVSFQQANFNDGNLFFSFATFGNGLSNFQRAIFGDGDKYFSNTVFGKGDVNFNMTSFGKGRLFSVMQYLVAAMFSFLRQPLAMEILALIR